MDLDRRHLLLAGLLAAAGCAAPTRRTATPRPSPNRPTPAPSARASATTAPSPRGPVPEITNGPRTAPRVALTFHGAGDPRLADALLAAAEKGGAKVTVLAVGTWLAANPGMADRILGAGHELGNHTWSHPVLPRDAAPATYDEIARCRDLLIKLTGSPGRWFRPSGTQHATGLIETETGLAGYAACLSYDVDSLDYTDPGGPAVVRRTLDGVQPGSIVSMHLGHQSTIEAMPAVLDGLHAKGLAPVTMSTLIPR